MKRGENGQVDGYKLKISKNKRERRERETRREREMTRERER